MREQKVEAGTAPGAKSLLRAKKWKSGFFFRSTLTHETLSVSMTQVNFSTYLPLLFCVWLQYEMLQSEINFSYLYIKSNTLLLFAVHRIRQCNPTNFILSYPTMAHCWKKTLNSNLKKKKKRKKRRCPWCNGYRRKKWTRRHEFKSWTSLIAFHIALIPLGKVWIQLFSLQLWVNSRAD